MRSFDGDRVMGIFVGPRKNSDAAECALRINWGFRALIRPRFEGAYLELRNGTFCLAHCTGIDTSEVLAVRTGIRKNNDLVWIGRAPNVAAKLSALRVDSEYSFISDAVYRRLNRRAKLGGDGREMWKRYSWSSGPINEIYGSDWQWSP